MISYQKETVSSFFKDAYPLFDEHHKEVSERQDLIDHNLNVDQYQIMEDRNMLEILTIRDDGKLIGYQSWILFKALHYKTVLTVSSDLLYILPEYRKGLFGYKFLKWSLSVIKKRKPQRVLIGIKPKNDFSKILKRLGANHFETTYSIVLEQ